MHTRNSPILHVTLIYPFIKCRNNEKKIHNLNKIGEMCVFLIKIINFKELKNVYTFTVDFIFQMHSVTLYASNLHAHAWHLQF